MIYFPVDLYELARSHQQQLRNEAQQERRARQAASGAGESERAEYELSRGGSILKTKGKARPAPGRSDSGEPCSPGHSCPGSEQSRRLH